MWRTFWTRDILSTAQANYEPRRGWGRRSVRRWTVKREWYVCAVWGNSICWDSGLVWECLSFSVSFFPCIGDEHKPIQPPDIKKFEREHAKLQSAIREKEAKFVSFANFLWAFLKSIGMRWTLINLHLYTLSVLLILDGIPRKRCRVFHPKVSSLDQGTSRVSRPNLKIWRQKERKTLNYGSNTTRS